MEVVEMKRKLRLQRPRKGKKGSKNRRQAKEQLKIGQRGWQRYSAGLEG
jgi:FtsZ-binding cell division protein ZapB